MQATISVPELKQPPVSPAKLALLVAVMLVMGITLVKNFAKLEEEREIAHWQNKLGLIADSRSADVSGWLAMHFRELGSVAANPSLQIYMTQLLSAAAQNTAPLEEPADAVFLRNLLLVTADRLGFLDSSSDALKAVHANIAHATGTGLAIVDNSGKIIVSTEGLPALDASLMAKVLQAPRAKASLIDMFAAEGGQQRIGFILPVYRIQGDPVPAQQIGMLIGIKTVSNDLLRLLVQPGATDKTLEAALIRKEGDNVVYLASPMDDGAQLSSRFSLATPDLDAAFALLDRGDFAIKRDRQSRLVLMTSRPISNSPWTLLLHIDRDQALAASDSWRVKMELIMGLALIAIVASIIAAWWYGSSKRAILLSLQTARLASHSMAQEKLLRVVSDNQPESIFIADSKHIVRFANEKAARQFHLPVSDMTGKDLSALMGPAAAEGYIEGNTVALATQKPFTRVPERRGEGTGLVIIRSEHIPLAHIPIDSLPYPSPGVLVVDQDVTQVVSEREHRVRIQRQLIDMLVRMVDARDPFAANHSASVALIAREVAQSLGLDPLTVDTAQTAGKLMNIGKIVVPSEILTKPAALAKNEMQAIAEGLQKSVALLRGIEFDGPVADTLAQAPERYDGTGPMKLKGDAILITARIIAVANSFVGMISERSYRAAMDIEKANTLLLQNIDTQFDRRVVVALINFVENKQGRQKLLEMAAKKAE